MNLGKMILLFLLIISLTGVSSACCSVLIHVSPGHDIFSFRRDSTYQATQYITRTSWNGQNSLIEYKTANTYFFHTIITGNGWIFSHGGMDNPQTNSDIEKLCGVMMKSGHITTTNLNKVATYIKSTGMGHLLVKNPNGYVGVVIYNAGILKLNIYHMKNGQYFSVPNDPTYFRTGTTTSKISSSVALENSDKWGVNRRNIITYDIGGRFVKIYTTKSKVTTQVCKDHPDSINYRGKVIIKPDYPTKYIGRVTL
jgi:hypothetical protein